MCIFFVRDINVQYEHFFIGGNDPFFLNSSVYLRRDDVTIVVTVLERHAPPNHASTQLELPLEVEEGAYLSCHNC